MKTFKIGGRRKLGIVALAGLMAVPALLAGSQVAQADSGFNPQNLRTVQAHNYNYQFRGRVEMITGDHSFNLKMHGDIYNVHTVHAITDRIDKGMRVEVAGDRVGKNDIRHAHFRILNK